jgi:hypothetical protein
MSSVVPLFKGQGFDDEATQVLGKAYDIACRSLHRYDFLVYSIFSIYFASSFFPQGDAVGRFTACAEIGGPGPP